MKKDPNPSRPEKTPGGSSRLQDKTANGAKPMKVFVPAIVLAVILIIALLITFKYR